MAAVFSTFLRGLVGVAASVLLVAVAWSLYMHRDAVTRVVAPLVKLVAPGTATTDSGSGTGAAAPAGDGAAATAPPPEPASAPAIDASSGGEPAAGAAADSGSGADASAAEAGAAAGAGTPRDTQQATPRAGARAPGQESRP